jgi:hypothetical protein
MRDLLGMSDDLEGLGQHVWIGGFARRLASFGSAATRRCTICSGEAPLSTRLRLIAGAWRNRRLTPIDLRMCCNWSARSRVLSAE